MRILNNLEKWKRNRILPIHIYKDSPYIRLFSNWVWNPKKGYFGFLAWDKEFK